MSLSSYSFRLESLTLKPEESSVLNFEADTSYLRQAITSFGSIKTMVSTFPGWNTWKKIQGTIVTYSK